MLSNVITHPPSLSPVQSPPKGVTIPYRPKPSGSPVIFAGGQVHTTHNTGSHLVIHDVLGVYCFSCLSFWFISVWDAYLCRILYAWKS